MRKIFELEDRFATGEPTIQLVMLPDGRGGRIFEKRAFDSAADSPAYEYLKTVTPKDGHSIVLVNALGAYEAYDDNRNGDAFPDRPVKVGEAVRCGHKTCQAAAWVAADEVLSKHYKTFEKFGGIYKHHVNKDPSKSLGKVLKAVWNPKMQRVELLLEIVNDRDQDLAKKIADGEYPAVSMGCLSAGTPITMADGRRVTVENIEVGHQVRTHLGNNHRVFELHRRTYQGVIHTIKPEAAPALVVTHEHPFHVVKKIDVKKRDVKGAWVWNSEAAPQGVWKLAEELDPEEHYLLQPINREVATPSYVTWAFARLLGYYLAEGNVLRDKSEKLCGVEFTCHEKDELLLELPDLCKDLGLSEPYIITRNNSAVARSARVFDADLAEKLALLAGCGAKAKLLDASIMAWAPTYQRALFGAYANGDGCGNKDGSLQVSTASADLAAQWLDLLPRLDILASHQVLSHKPNALVKIATTEHVVFIGAQWAQGLRDVCAKVKPHELKTRKESRKIFGDYVVTPIRSIERASGIMPVYNFEVEEDNSYVAGGVAVHNCHVKWDVCSICGHRAPTRKDYCEHARNKMRQVLSNGEKVCVHNPSPRFFDISFVFRPADPTGFMLKKVASAYELWSGPSAKMGELADEYEQKIADARKLGDIRKQLLGQVAASRQNADIKKYQAVAKENAKSRQRASEKDIAKLSEYPFSIVASTFAAKNAALSTSDVAKIFLKKAGVSSPDWLIDRIVAVQPVVEAAFARAPGLYEKLSHLVEISDQNVRPALYHTVDAWVEKTAGMSDYIRSQAFGPSSLNLPVGPGALYRATEPAATDVLTLTDPTSGHVYQTTRGAAQKQHHENMKHKLFGSLALSALYATALHHGLKKKVPLWATLPVSGFLGVKTYNVGQDLLSPLRNPEYITDQGISVPGNTEFVKASAISAPTLLDKIAFDVIERVGDVPRPIDALQLKVAYYAPDSAIAKFLLHPSDEQEKAAALIEGLEKFSDTVSAPEVDFHAFGTRVGSLLLS